MPEDTRSKRVRRRPFSDCGASVGDVLVLQSEKAEAVYAAGIAVWGSGYGTHAAVGYSLPLRSMTRIRA